jgi:hypothetical protein
LALVNDVIKLFSKTLSSTVPSNLAHDELVVFGSTERQRLVDRCGRISNDFFESQWSEFSPLWLYGVICFAINHFHHLGLLNDIIIRMFSLRVVILSISCKALGALSRNVLWLSILVLIIHFVQCWVHFTRSLCFSNEIIQSCVVSRLLFFWISSDFTGLSNFRVLKLSVI